MPQRRRRTTIKDVAAATGLSPAAVSYALRGLQVPVETQERVRAAADELGYEADPIARALSSGRTGTVGVLLGSFGDLWQQRLAVGLSRALLAADLNPVIVDASGDPAREPALVRRVRDQRVDGVVCSPLDPAGEHWAELSAVVPVVSLGDAIVHAPKAGSVLFDNRRGVTEALEHLARLGHRRVAVLTTSLPSTPDRPADVVVHQQGARLGLDVLVRSSPASVAGATDAARAVLQGPDRPTAAFCLSDSMAFGVYAAARDLGLRVPQDLSVLGYDDHEVAGLVAPPLTTFAWDLAGIVEAAVGQLVLAVELDGRPQRRTFAPALVERGSTAPPAD